MPSSPDASELQRMYAARFAGRSDYRDRVWKTLAAYFSQWISPTATVLDLGAGHGEFINNVAASVKYAMDLNPDVRKCSGEAKVLEQDCLEPWPLADGELDAVFTSNFLEHLPDKAAVRAVLSHAWRCLKPGGRFIAMGPNIKCVPGDYWDFFDHYVALTEMSLSEALTNSGFSIERQVARFLPYTMAKGRQYPTWMLRLYLALPAAWPMFGKQFLVVARKPAPEAPPPGSA
jgi:SAM-dependent methyltransferase